MIDIQGLLEFGELGTRLIAGGAGVRRRVTWAHVSELTDPTPWLEGGELIMTTGLGVPRTPADQVAYVTRLADAGVAALAVGENMYAPPLSDRMLARAGELSLPVLVVRRDVPFTALAQRVATANRDSLHESLALHLRVLEIARRVAEQRVEPLEVVAGLSALTNFELFVLDAAGAPLFPGGTPSPIDLDAARLDSLGTTVRPTPLDGVDAAGHGAAFLLPVVAKGLRIGTLLALSGQRAATRRLVLEHVVTVVNLLADDVVRRRDLERAALDARLAVFSRPTRGRDPSVADLFPAAPQTSVATAVAVEGATEADWARCHHRLPPLAATAVAPDEARLARWLIVVSDEDAMDGLEHELEHAFPHATAGLSSTCSLSAAVCSLRSESLDALQRALLLRRRVLRFDAAPSAPARELLQPLLEYDAARGTVLTDTLHVFLETDRSWKQAAQRLGVHRQTLVHRVKRIESLTGRSLRRTEDIAALWFALHDLR